ncbi:MAG: TetR/AcrR family transcriptional regulator [Kineosporiaceae bacterium]
MTANAASPAQGVRARVRQEMRVEILRAARRHLAEEGAAGLSFRAVARDVGLVSSAVYRYFPSRDALLTALIVESYDALGEAVERREADVPRDRYADRYRAVGRAAREWADTEPRQWALIFGSPIPGYAAPRDTVGPATRVPVVLARLLADAHAAGAVTRRDDVLAPALHDALLLRSVFQADVPDELLVRGLIAWTYVLGSVSAQLFGHRHQVIADDAFATVFDVELDRMVELVGLPA